MNFFLRTTQFGPLFVIKPARLLLFIAIWNLLCGAALLLDHGLTPLQRSSALVLFVLAGVYLGYCGLAPLFRACPITALFRELRRRKACVALSFSCAKRRTMKTRRKPEQMRRFSTDLSVVFLPPKTFRSSAASSGRRVKMSGLLLGHWQSGNDPQIVRQHRPGHPILTMRKSLAA